MNIETRRLILRAMKIEDASFLADLVNDPEVRDVLGAYSLVFPLSRDMEERWISEAVKKDDEAHLIITMRKGARPIGILSIKDLNHRNASGHLSIIIGKNSWDRGYGTEAVTGMLDFLFYRMNLRRVWLRVDESNARAIRCYEKCGFKKEGKLRQDHFAHGQWANSFIMSVLADERGRRER